MNKTISLSLSIYIYIYMYREMLHVIAYISSKLIADPLYITLSSRRAETSSPCGTPVICFKCVV